MSSRPRSDPRVAPPPLGRLARSLRSTSSSQILLAAGAIHFLFLFFLGLSHHWSYLSSVLDLGAFDQSLWGILNGTPFQTTANVFGVSINWLGVHFNPILAFFSPLYAIFPAAEWLVLIQALAISMAVWPLYALGVRVCSSERAALLWSFAYLLNPFVLGAAAWDFHPMVLAAPVLAWALLAVEKGNAKILLFCGLLLLLIQEQYGVAVGGLGLLYWIRQRALLPSLLTLAMAGIGFGLVMVVIMPALSPTGGHIMIGEELGQLGRYGWLGTSPGGVFRSLLSDPILVLTFVLKDMGGWIYLGFLIVPLALTPLFGFEFLLPGVADFAANLLSANTMPRSPFAYHSIGLVPILIVAGMHGARRLSRFKRYSVAGLGRLALLGTLLVTYRLLPLPLPGAINAWAPVEYRIWPEQSLREVRASLPPTVSVSAQPNIGSHFTHRAELRVFPDGVGEVDCVVLRLASPTKRIHESDVGEIGSLAHHLQMDPAAFLSTVEELIASGEYGLKTSEPPWMVLCRDAESTAGDRQLLLSELDGLAQKWLGFPRP